MQRRRLLAATFALSAAIPIAGASFRVVAQAPQSQKAAAGSLANREPVAEVDGVSITNEQLEKVLGANLRKLQEQIYDMKRQALDALITERLLAAEAERRKITPSALLDAEVTSKVTLVTEQEVDAYYGANKAQLQNQGNEEQIRSQVRTGLQNQKIQAQRQAFVDGLKAKAKVAVLLAAPPVQRVEVNIAGAPFWGPSTAPVTIVEFSDFHCPFCKQVEDTNTLKQLRTKYGDRVKLVWIDYPIDQLHPQARKVHEAARCAGEQNKFWEYHQAAYTGGPKTGDQLTQVAQQVGLDLPKFQTCFSGGKYQAAVQKDIEQAKNLGVTGTPTFFINGRSLVGAQPLEAFVRAIDDELVRGKSSAPKLQ